jgi:hypothetical protein
VLGFSREEVVQIAEKYKDKTEAEKALLGRD